MRTFLFGMILGAIAGVMYAPSTGSRTRALVRDQYTKLSTDTSDFIERHRGDLSTKIESIRQDVDLLVDDLRGRYGEVSTMVQEQAGPLKERMIDVREDVKTRIGEARIKVEEKVEELKESRKAKGEDELRESA